MQRILVYQTAFIGDVVLTIPLIRAIKRAYRNASITVIVKPGAAELIDALEEVDNVIKYDKNGEERGLYNFYNLVKILRKMKFNIAICPHRSFRSSMLMALSGIPVRVGFKESAFSFLYTHRASREEGRHEIEKNLSLLERLCSSVEFKNGHTGFKISGDIKNRAVKILSDNGISGNDKVIIVAPGSRWATKRWLPEGFGEVITRLTSDGYRVVITGSETDRDVANSVEKFTRGRVLNLCGQTSFIETAGLISISSVLLSNDNATVHIASLVGTPVVEIYGPTIPAFGFSPYGVRSEILEVKDLYCRPCSSHGPMRCPERHFMCMKSINPSEVYRAVIKVLQKDAQ